MEPIYSSVDTPSVVEPRQEEEKPFSKPEKSESFKPQGRPLNFKPIDKTVMEKHYTEQAKEIKDADLDQKGIENTKEF